MKTPLIAQVEAKQLKSDVPDFRPGDTVRVHVRITEKSRNEERTRVQPFEGVVIRRAGGGINETVTVRRVTYGIGVERSFPLHAPVVDRIEVVRRGQVRRARLYYLRGLSGRASRIKGLKVTTDQRSETTQPATDVPAEHNEEAPAVSEEASEEAQEAGNE